MAKVGGLLGGRAGDPMGARLCLTHHHGDSADRMVALLASKPLHIRRTNPWVLFCPASGGQEIRAFLSCMTCLKQTKT